MMAGSLAPSSEDDDVVRETLLEKSSRGTLVLPVVVVWSADKVGEDRARALCASSEIRFLYYYTAISSAISFACPSGQLTARPWASFAVPAAKISSYMVTHRTDGLLNPKNASASC